MTRALFIPALFLMIGLAAPAHAAAPVVGKPAPGFSALTAEGKTIHLTDFKGKTVILEWTNHECPFVKKHYDSKNMQDLQKKTTGDGAVWLSIISSAPGKQGNVDGVAAVKLTKDRGAAPTHVVLDPSGLIGKMYDAKTTPHMYIIDKTGALTYAGAIDDKPSTDQADIKTSKNYVSAALADMAAGKPVATPESKAYGCNVKYE